VSQFSDISIHQNTACAKYELVLQNSKTRVYLLSAANRRHQPFFPLLEKFFIGSFNCINLPKLWIKFSYITHKKVTVPSKIDESLTPHLVRLRNAAEKAWAHPGTKS